MTEAKRLQTYEGEGITVSFDPKVCVHSGVCARGLPRVFMPKEKRWVRLDGATADEIEAQVGRCPSGALKFARRAPDSLGE